jgi:hypothetical protein
VNGEANDLDDEDGHVPTDLVDLYVEAEEQGITLDGSGLLQLRNLSMDLHPGSAGGRIVSVDGEPVKTRDLYK